MYVWKSYFSSIPKKNVKIPLTKIKIKIKVSRYFIFIISVLGDDEDPISPHYEL